MVNTYRGQKASVALCVNSAVWIGIAAIAHLNPPADWEASLDPRFLDAMGVVGTTCVGFVVARHMKVISY
jgi:hypothetical protein